MGSKPRDAPMDPEEEELLMYAEFFQEEGMYYRGISPHQRRQWKYHFPKKGETMSNEDFTPIPVQNWDSNMKCPKCEGEKDELVIKWKNGSPSEDTVNGEKYDLPEGFEHLLCKCNSCGFEWLMQTADADERATAAKEAADERSKGKDKEDEDKDEDVPVIARGHGARVVRGGA